MSGYEHRVVVYADVLGWREEAQKSDPSRALTSVTKIHERTAHFNAETRRKLREETDEHVRKGAVPVGPRDPSLREIQFGTFSDHFVFSGNPFVIGSLLDIVAALVVDLLHLGFLVRGAVVLGKLYHQDNIVFGPGLLTAITMEEREAFYPRLLLTDEVVKEYFRGEAPFVHGACAIKDQLGRYVMNPFVVPFRGSDSDVESFEQEYFRLREIKKTIETNVDTLVGSKHYSQAEKWIYLRRLIEGPVFDAAPQLRQFWK